jgi:hypothetical protein
MYLTDYNLALPGIGPRPSSPEPVAIPTELFRLLPASLYGVITQKITVYIFNAVKILRSHIPEG